MLPKFITRLHWPVGPVVFFGAQSVPASWPSSPTQPIAERSRVFLVRPLARSVSASKKSWRRHALAALWLARCCWLLVRDKTQRSLKSGGHPSIHLSIRPLHLLSSALLCCRPAALLHPASADSAILFFFLLQLAVFLSLIRRYLSASFGYTSYLTPLNA